MRWLLILALLGCQTGKVVEKKDPNKPPPTTEGTWGDPVTGSRWFIGTVPVIYEQAVKACSNQWRQPTVEELELAWTRNLSGPVVWSVEISPARALTYDLKSGVIAAQPKTATATVACVNGPRSTP